MNRSFLSSRMEGSATRPDQLASVKPFNSALEHVQSAADALAARCSLYEHVLMQGSAIERLEKAVDELRAAYDAAAALKD